jgi:hypothetical protein
LTGVVDERLKRSVRNTGSRVPLCKKIEIITLDALRIVDEGN